MSASVEAQFRKAVVRAFERIPVADRGWNDRVAEALWADEWFRADMAALLAPAHSDPTGEVG